MGRLATPRGHSGCCNMSENGISSDPVNSGGTGRRSPSQFHLWLYSYSPLAGLRFDSPGGGLPRGTRESEQRGGEDIMNSVHLIGRLATDVDVKEVNGGSTVVV